MLFKFTLFVNMNHFILRIPHFNWNDLAAMANAAWSFYHVLLSNLADKL